MEKYLFIILLAYFLGSIPFGYILGRLVTKQDIRTKGSGNIGTTNAFRTSGPAVGLLTLFFDALKGFLSCYLALRIMPTDEAVALAGFFAMVGHCFSAFLKFKGGKGIATSAGVVLYIDYRLLLILLAVFILILVVTKIVSFSSIIAALSAPFITFLLGLEKPYIIMVLVIVAIVIYRHMDNIKRLRAGTESKIGRKKVQE